MTAEQLALIEEPQPAPLTLEQADAITGDERRVRAWDATTADVMDWAADDYERWLGRIGGGW